MFSEDTLLNTSNASNVFLKTNRLLYKQINFFKIKQNG